MSDTQVIGATGRSSSSLSDRSLARAARALLPGRLHLGKARRFVSPLVIVLLWQAASMAGLISPRTLAAPSTVIASAWELTLSGELPHHLLVSLGRVALGLSIGVAAGTAFALIAGLSKLGEEIVDAPLQMLRTLPFLALVPLFILWFGIGEIPAILTAFLISFFPIVVNVATGLATTEPELEDVLRALEAAGE